jgi:hypothetical protein
VESGVQCCGANLCLTVPLRHSRGVCAAGQYPWYVRVAGIGLLVGVSLLLTVLRHEALHIAGVYLTGGMITHIVWLPQLGTLAAVEMAPPLTGGLVSYYLPLLLPYIGDGVLIVLSTQLCRPWQSLRLRWVIFQHAAYFAMLDIVINCAAAFVWPNDWSLISATWSILQYPALLLVMVVTVLLATWQRHMWWREHTRLLTGSAQAVRCVVS